MARRFAAPIVLVAVALLAGCGGGDDQVNPANPDAGITAVRADLVASQLGQVTEALRSGIPLDSLPFSGAPQAGDSPSEDSPPSGRSGRSVKEEMQAERSAFLQRYRR